MGIITLSKAIEKTGLPRSTFQRQTKKLNVPTVTRGGKVFYEEEILDKYFPSEKKGLARVVSFANQKGGIGKTTTCLNLAIAFSKIGHKLLVVDMDPQGNLSGQWVKDLEELDHTVGNLLDLKAHGFHQAKLERTIVKTEYFDLLPSNITLANFDIARDLIDYDRLDIFLKTVKGAYDWIFVDCPPSLDIKLLNALIASDYVIIPNTPSKFSVQGLASLRNTIEKAKTKNTKLQAVSLVNQFMPELQVASMTKRIEDYFTVLNTKIPRSTDIEKSQIVEKGLDAFAPKKFKPYMDLALEVIKLWQK